MARLLKGPDGNPMTDAEILHALRVYATNKYGGENKYDFLAIGDTIAQVESGNNPFACNYNTDADYYLPGSCDFSCL
jgi:hypothetical protein